jgi:hypothetical protein
MKYYANMEVILKITKHISNNKIHTEELIKTLDDTEVWAMNMEFSLQIYLPMHNWAGIAQSV